MADRKGGIEFKPLDGATYRHFKNRTSRTENTEYWIERELRSKSTAKSEKELLSDMKRLYRDTVAEIDREIQAFYGRYATENGLTLAEVHKRLNPAELKRAKEDIERYYRFADPKKIGRNMSEEYRQQLRLLSARAYMSRLEEIKMRIQHVCVKMAAEQEEKFTERLAGVYADAHSYASYEVDKGLGFSTGYSAPDSDALGKALQERWLGDNYSGRIWADKARLSESLNTLFMQGVARGQNPKKIAEAMSDRYGTDYRNCERLARTEFLHMENAATYDSYKAHGVEKYKFVCGLDERTCPICGALDGSVHELKYKQEGINYPVMHPNCYDESTQVLTRDGWKLFKDCSSDDEYFSMNPDNPGETDYLKAMARISDRTLLIIEFRYGRKLVRVTENHDMLVKSDGKLHFMKAKNLLSLSLNAIGRDIFILDDRLSEIPLSDFSCTFEQGWFSVYCVELPKWHTLLVRRNGSTPVWCGNCRCTTVPYFDDEISRLFDDSETTRLAYDEERKHYDVPASMTYTRWREMVGADKKD